MRSEMMSMLSSVLMALAFQPVESDVCHEVRVESRKVRTPEQAALLLASAQECPEEVQGPIRRQTQGLQAQMKSDVLNIVVVGRRASRPRPRIVTPAPAPDSRGAREKVLAATTPAKPERPVGAGNPSRDVPAPVPPGPPPAPSPVMTAAAERLQPGDSDTLKYRDAVLTRQFTDRADCPGLGWVGLVDSGGSSRRVTFDGIEPVEGPAPGVIPDLADIMVFSAQAPVLVFQQSVPCYVLQASACNARRESGRFVVIARVRFNAGAGGGWRWQLCVAREGEVRI
jgi:hypothetical protein